MTLAASTLTPTPWVELTEIFLRRIERLDQDLNGFITVTREQALATRGAHAMSEIPADTGPAGAA